MELGIRVLDVGCGRGRAVNLLAVLSPSTIVGYDRSEEAIAYARDEAAREGHANARFEARDLRRFEEVSEPSAFDLVTSIDVTYDQARPMGMLRSIRRSLRDGGVYLAQAIMNSSYHHVNRDHPQSALSEALGCMERMPDLTYHDGDWFGSMWGRELAERYFCEAGFSSVEVHGFPRDPFSYFFVCRPPLRHQPSACCH